MKIIIAGGRDFNNLERLFKVCDRILKELDEIEIVSGMCPPTKDSQGNVIAWGADMLGLMYAKDREYKIHEFPADWDGLGRKAGPLRNGEMAIYADGLIAFWDGKSRGTKNMIDTAKKLELKVRVIKYEI